MFGKCGWNNILLTMDDGHRRPMALLAVSTHSRIFFSFQVLVYGNTQCMPFSCCGGGNGVVFCPGGQLVTTQGGRVCEQTIICGTLRCVRRRSYRNYLSLVRDIIPNIGAAVVSMRVWLMIWSGVRTDDWAYDCVRVSA